MKVVVMVFSVEAIPIGALIGAVFACPLSRRSNFWLRLTAVVITMLLPALVASLAPLPEQTAGMLLLLGFVWGILLLAPSRFVLFQGRGFGPGADDEDGRGPGPGPGDGGPTPTAPVGGIPLPDAEPSSKRVRDHPPPRPSPRRRRPALPRERPPSRPRPLRQSGHLRRDAWTDRGGQDCDRRQPVVPRSGW
jgi:hypothetical protein